MPTRELVTRYEQELELFPDVWHRIGLALAAAVLLAFPFVASAHWLNIGSLTLVTIVGSLALMILTGFTGQISLGHAAFLALGAYTAAILGNRFGIPFWLTIPAAGFVAAAVGVAIGPFALRLEGLYLAIVTLGLLFLVNHVLLSFPSLSGGVAGISVPMPVWFSEGGVASADFRRPFSMGKINLSGEQKLYFLYVILVITLLWIANNLRRSNTGRAMMAVRDHDMAAQVMGVNVARTKVTAFGISSFFAGVAGAMFAFQQQYITVDPPFNLGMSVQYIAMIILGGVGTLTGAVAGAIAFIVLTPVTEVIGRMLPLVQNLTSAQQSTLLFALIVIGFLLFEPLGLYGIWLRVKRYFMAWPFKY
jgi:branched-chain amino acid transport system permease protein